jgi:DNA-binding response OmpR family regulator
MRGYSRFARIPILFLTAWDTRIGFGRDVDVVMRKPFAEGDLVAKVEALLATAPPPR